MGRLGESIQALSRLKSMQPEDFIQILRRSYAQWVAEFQRNLSGISVES